MQGIPHDYFVSSSIFSFLLSQQHTKWRRRGQIISSTIPSAECYRNFLRPRKHNVPSCSSAPPELGTAPNFLPSTKPAPPSKPTTYNPALYFPPSPSVAAVSHSREILSPLLTSKSSHSIQNGHWRDISSHWTNYVP